MKGTRRITVYISLGSNLGDPKENLRQATLALAWLPGLELGRLSPVYLTEPQGMKAQPWFANQVAEAFCPASLSPEALLEALLGLELRLGRVRSPGAPSNAPRVIDLDLLLMGDIVRAFPDPILPHPRLRERAFVLVPLLDIAPELVFPGGLGSALDVLRGLKYRLEGDKIYQ